MLWEDLREEEFEGAIKRSGGLCVVPIGCLEKHGEHGPVGTDYFVAHDLCEEAAKITDVVVFPLGAWVGDMSGAHRNADPGKAPGNRGNIAMKPSTLLLVLSELCDEIARNGFTKILFVDGHGGNVELLNNLVKHDRRYENRSYVTMRVSTHGKGLNMKKVCEIIKANRADYPELSDKEFDIMQYHADHDVYGHADQWETLLVMADRPETVNLQRSADFDGHSTGRTDYLKELGVEIGGWGADFPNQYHGDAQVDATQAMAIVTKRIAVDNLAHIFDVLKHDEECLKI